MTAGGGLSASPPQSPPPPPPPFDDEDPNRWEREKTGDAAAATEPAVNVDEVEEEPEEAEEEAEEEVEEIESWVSWREPRARRRNESDCFKVSARAVAVDVGVRIAGEATDDVDSIPPSLPGLL